MRFLVFMIRSGRFLLPVNDPALIASAGSMMLRWWIVSRRNGL